MENIVFYNETGMNGKYQVISSVELEGAGTNYGGRSIHEHAGKLHKNLNYKYWVNRKQLDEIKARPAAVRTSFT
jgi:hypothetical protein